MNEKDLISAVESIDKEFLIEYADFWEQYKEVVKLGTSELEDIINDKINELDLDHISDLVELIAYKLWYKKILKDFGKSLELC